MRVLLARKAALLTVAALLLTVAPQTLYAQTLDANGQFPVLAQGQTAGGAQHSFLIDADGTLHTTGGGGGGGGGAVTAASGSYASGALAAGSVASGAMVDLGAIADAVVAAGASGTVHAKLRRLTTDLSAALTTLNAISAQLPAALDGSGFLKIHEQGTATVTQTAATSTSATLQNAVSSTVNGSALTVDGMGTVAFTVTGSFTATVNFQGSEDGTNYFALNATPISSTTAATTATTTGVYTASCAGLKNVRATVTWVSGTTVTVTAHAVPFGGGSGGGGGAGGGAVTIADNANATFGAKADTADTHTDTTPITAMAVLKEISAKAQATRTETSSATRNSAGNIVALATALNANTAASVVVVDLTGHLGGVLQFTQVFPNAAPTATTGLVVQIGYNVSGSNTSDTQYFTTWTLASVQNATQTGSIRLDGGYKYAVLVKDSDTTSAITYGITLDTNDRVTN